MATKIKCIVCGKPAIYSTSPFANPDEEAWCSRKCADITREQIIKSLSLSPESSQWLLDNTLSFGIVPRYLTLIIKKMIAEGGIRGIE